MSASQVPSPTAPPTPPGPSFAISRWFGFTVLATFLVYLLDLLAALSSNRRDATLESLFGDGSLFLVAAVFGAAAIGEVSEGPRTWRRILLQAMGFVIAALAVGLFALGREDIRASDTGFITPSSGVYVEADEAGDLKAVPLGQPSRTARQATKADLVRLDLSDRLLELLVAEEMEADKQQSDKRQAERNVARTSVVFAFAALLSASTATIWRARIEAEGGP